jgi:hypothetical protein
MNNTNVTGTLNTKVSSATAFQVQNGSSQSVLTADTSANQVLFGQASALTGVLAIANSTNGNLIKLTSGITSGTGYTLTMPTTGATGTQCLQSTSGSTSSATSLQWGSCGGGGGGGATHKVVLAPEYPGGVLHADGSNNTGTLTSDYASRHTYYEWTATGGTAQDYDIIVNTAIPSEYASAMGSVGIWAYSSNTGNTPSATIQLEDGAGNVCGGSTSSIVPGSNTTWTQMPISSLSGCTFAGGDIITFTIHVTSKSGALFRVGELYFSYTN